MDKSDVKSYKSGTDDVLARSEYISFTQNVRLQ